MLIENGIPKHLKRYVAVKEPKTIDDAFIVSGKLKCTCGTEEFCIIREKAEPSFENKTAEKKIKALFEKYRKELHSKGTICETGTEDGKWCIAHIVYPKKGGRQVNILEDITELHNYMLSEQQLPIFLETVCTQCGQKILVFDSSKHGFDSLANTETNYTKDIKTAKKPKCRKCGSESSKLNIKISSTGKNDLFSESGEIVNNDNWKNAFDWITVDLECSKCGKITKKYLDIETNNVRFFRS